MSTTSNGRKWLMFFILLFCGITVSLSQLKISPLMGEVAAMLNVNETQAALLMSLFTVAGIILSIPGAALMAKTGNKNMLLILMGTLVIGNVLGAVTNHFAVVMLSRIIEGISYALIITVGVDLINSWFTGATVGTATGIFNTFAAAANFIGMNGAVAIYNATNNLKVLWWIVAALAAVCFVLVLLVVRVDRAEAAAEAMEKATLVEAVENPPLLLTCLSMLCLAFVLFGFITCNPMLFASYGVSSADAAFYSSLNGLIGIPVCIISGVVVGKTGKPFHFAIVGAVLCAIICFAMPHLGGGNVACILYALATGIVPGGMIMTSMFIFTPQLAKRPALIGLSMGLLNTLYYIGVFACTPVITAMVGENPTPANWVAPSLLMVGCCVVVLLCSIAAMTMSKKQRAAV